MSNSVPPEQRPPRLRDDEPIAILVAFLTFGAIFGWVAIQGRDGLNLFSWLNGFTDSTTRSGSLVGNSPSPIEAPLPNPLLKPSQTGEATKGNTNAASAGKKGGPSATSDAETTSPTAPGLQAGLPTTAVPTPAAPSPAPVPSASTNPTIAPVPVPSNTLQGGQRPIPPAASSSPIDFPDVPSSYWAYPFIRDLSSRGVIGGFPDGNFQPDQPVTRGQFAIQLQKAFTKADRLPPKLFGDVSKNYAIAVDKAVKSNFMSGYPDGNFRPDQNVSRTEAVISLIRGLGLPEPADPEAILQAYQDQDQVPSWARGKIAAAIQAKVFSGDPDTLLLNPNQPATRADIAAFVYKALGLPDPQ